MLVKKLLEIQETVMLLNCKTLTEKLYACIAAIEAFEKKNELAGRHTGILCAKDYDVITFKPGKSYEAHWMAKDMFVICKVTYVCN